jgi:hypothetical protein
MVIESRQSALAGLKLEKKKKKHTIMKKWYREVELALCLD